jgi:hypothetical protein
MTLVTGARRNFLRLAWRSEARVANEKDEPDSPPDRLNSIVGRGSASSCVLAGLISQKRRARVVESLGWKALLSRALVACLLRRWPFRFAQPLH